MAEIANDLASAEYQALMTQVVLAARCIDDTPFDRMLATIQRAHSVGPILYPGDYREAAASGSLDAQQRMLTAARDFVATLADVKQACA